MLHQLLNSTYPEIKNLSITVLVRKQEQVDLLKQKGINAVLFNGLDDSEQLRKAASEHDYVIHTPSGFHTGSAVALIEGLGDRKKQTGKEVYFVQVSHWCDDRDCPDKQTHCVDIGYFQLGAAHYHQGPHRRR